VRSGAPALLARRIRAGYVQCLAYAVTLAPVHGDPLEQGTGTVAAGGFDFGQAFAELADSTRRPLTA